MSHVDSWFCECRDPHTDGLGMCFVCFRKARSLMQ